MSAESFLGGKAMLCCGDSIHFMRDQPDNRYDFIVCDPPYALVSIVKRFGSDNSAPANGDVYKRSSAGFMGKKWDTGDSAHNAEFWREALRVLKPGGYVLAFAGTRTYHRLACAIEDAGFEIRDMISWLYGSGFPKSHDVSKGIDKKRDDRDDILRITSFMADAAELASITRAEIDAHMGTSDMGGWWLSRLKHRCQCPKWDQWLQLKSFLSFGNEMDAEVWRLNGRKGQPGEAWQTAEIIGEREKLESWNYKGNNVYQTGGLEDRVTLQIRAANTDDAREWQGWGTALKPACEPICMARKPLSEGTVAANVVRWGTGAINVDGCRVGTEERVNQPMGARFDREEGRDLTKFAEWQVTQTKKTATGRWPANVIHDGSEEVVAGGASIWAADGGGLNGNSGTEAWTDSGSAARFFYTAKADSDDRLGSKHPTVKPVDLMQYLVRLVTPKGGLVLDPFAGTGTTAEACFREGMTCAMVEREPEYQADIRRRMALVMGGPEERRRESIKAKKLPIDHGPLFSCG